MTTLARGANAEVTTGRIELAVRGARPGSVDLLVLQLGASMSVRSDADLVFFNQPRSPEGAVELLAGDRVAVDLRAVPADVTALAVAVALDEGEPGALRDVAGLGVGVGAEHDAPADGLTTERAAVLVELYRRGPGWKVRCVSAGWADGLATLLREHGVAVDDEPAPATAAPAPPPAAPVGGADWLRKAEKVSLTKRRELVERADVVEKVLLTKNAGGVRARVVLVIDKTGSMAAQYSRGVVHRVVERMVPVAVRLDDDGTLEPYLYARGFLRLPDLRVEDLDHWPARHLHRNGVRDGVDYNAIGHGNDEIPIMEEILGALNPGDAVPTLVLFFTDGGFAKKREITALMRDAAQLPAFWQFVGLGRAKYGVLERLDELEGRVVDNAGFFALDDIDAVSDEELYQRLLGEFPDWLRAARAARIVG